MVGLVIPYWWPPVEFMLCFGRSGAYGSRLDCALEYAQTAPLLRLMLGRDLSLTLLGIC